MTEGRSSGCFVILLRHFCNVTFFYRTILSQSLWFLSVLEQNIGVREEVADKALLFRAQLRINLINDLFFCLFGKSRKMVAIAPLLKRD